MLKGINNVILKNSQVFSVFTILIFFFIFKALVSEAGLQFLIGILFPFPLKYRSPQLEIDKNTKNPKTCSGKEKSVFGPWVLTTLLLLLLLYSGPWSPCYIFWSLFY